MIRTKRTLAAVATTLAIAIFACSGVVRDYGNPHGDTAGDAQTPKYIFFFLADGAGPTHLEVTRQYNREILGEELIISDKVIRDGFLGLMTTHAADSLSTDSAAAATALASGCKANVGALGMCADGTVPATVMEIAKQRGFKIGLITNSTVYDASPAAFVCHVPSRRDYVAIINRYLDLEPDVIMGGGRSQFLPRGAQGSRRKDATDMLGAFEKKGYHRLSEKRDLTNPPPGRLLGLFSRDEMSFELDRDKNTEPSVYDMTDTAIRQLHDANANGFFLFVENENTDGGSHLSDIASVIHDYRQFDRAVGLAYEFYRKYPRDTLIIVTSDHETGGLGLTMALKDVSDARGTNLAASGIQDLKKIQSIKISLHKASQILGPHPTGESIDRLMREHFSGFTLAPEYREAILHRRPVSRTIYLDPTANALGMMIANNTQIYWLTTSHTNQPVLVAAIGAGAARFAGYYDNAELGRRLKQLLDRGMP